MFALGNNWRILDESFEAKDMTPSKITICGGAGEQVKGIVKALQGLADALATLVDNNNG